MRRFLILLVLLIGASVFAYVEYTWANRVISNYNQGWTVISRQRDWRFMKPWTWVKNPVYRILLSPNGAYGKISNQYYFAHTVTHNMWDESSESTILLDVVGNKFAFSSSLEDVKILDDETMNNLDWHRILEFSIVHELSVFLKTNAKRYVALNPLGEEIDISSYIMSGNYKVSDGDNEGRVWSLINEAPYVITDADLLSLEQSLRKWYSENPAFEPDSMVVSQTQIEYLHSQMLFTLTDIYQLRIKGKHNGNDTLLNRECTFTKLYYPGYSLENEVIFIDNEVGTTF